MSLLIGDIVTDTNILDEAMATTISEVSPNNIVVTGFNVINVDYVKYYLAKRLKKNGMSNYRINEKSLHNILTDPHIRKHYQEKKAEKHHH